MKPRRHTVRSLAALAALLIVSMVLSGCAVVGAMTGLVAGAALGGPEGAAAGCEAGFYIGAAIDTSLIEIFEEQEEDLSCVEPDGVVPTAPPSEWSQGDDDS
jgi:hypothetical protein